MQFLMWFAALAGPSVPEDEVDPWVPYEIVIAGSEKTYAAALKRAMALSEGSGLPLQLRVGYDPSHKDVFGGLTYTPEECEGDGYPCYYTRGRVGGREPHVSIEWSSSVRGLTEGLYIVVADVDSDAASAKATLAKVKPVIPDAYIKSGRIYLGCMH